MSIENETKQEHEAKSNQALKIQKEPKQKTQKASKAKPGRWFSFWLLIGVAGLYEAQKLSGYHVPPAVWKIIVPTLAIFEILHIASQITDFEQKRLAKVFWTRPVPEWLAKGLFGFRDYLRRSMDIPWWTRGIIVVLAIVVGLWWAKSSSPNLQTSPASQVQNQTNAQMTGTKD